MISKIISKALIYGCASIGALEIAVSIMDDIDIVMGFMFLIVSVSSVYYDFLTNS